jgi:D-alanyl-D-alanine carboxypeptidase/D-alanyl-D-alanine-endopeptidase (penicillin-binding protein 4)
MTGRWTAPASFFFLAASLHAAKAPIPPVTAAATAAVAPLAPTKATPKKWFGTPTPLLKQDLLDFAARTGVDGELGFAVYSVRHQRFEAVWNDTGFLTPASCLKLIVTAAALDTFPVNTYPTTTLIVSGTRRGRTLRGSLRVEGGGDPNISDRFFPDAVTPLRAWADSLKALGIDTVRGQLTVSDTFFTGPHRPTAWAARHFNTWYGAEVSALSFNDNTYEIYVSPGERAGDPARVRIEPDVGHVRVINSARTRAGGANGASVSQGSGASDETVVTVTGTLGARAGTRRWVLPVRNPTDFFRSGLLKALEEGGLVYLPDNAAASGPSGKTGAIQRRFRLTTAPMASMLDEINQRSQNLHAELLLRHLGKRVVADGSVEGGIAAEKRFLDALGLDSAAFDIHDGCGLSSLNAVRTREMTLLLARMARHRFAHDYIATLASPGLDGATGKRLRDYADAGLVRYKTGSLGGVAGLAGYVFADDGDTLAVVYLLNRYTAPSLSASGLLDSLMMHTALWVNKERPAAAAAYKLLAAARYQPGVQPGTLPGVPLDFTERLRFFSKALEGTPYFLGPTGEGRYGAIDPNPIVDFTRFDCVTFLETVVGLALSRQAPELLPNVLSIRYHGDTIAYPNRNHYFTGEWIAYNPTRFRVLQIPGDTVITKTLARRNLLAAKGLKGSDVPAKIRYVPYEKALKLAQNWNLGNRMVGVAFMTARDGIDATHTGFVDVRDDANGGRPLLRHASQLQGRVAEQDFAEYLESRRGKCSGVLFFEFLPPASGG